MSSTPFEKPHFLLVEDSVSFRQLFGEALKLRFPTATVVQAGSCEEAQAALEAATFDLMVADIFLPDGDGRELMRRALARPQPPRCLALTGQPEQELVRELLGMGVAGFVDKASPLEHVMLAAGRVLEGGVFFSTNLAPPKPTGRATVILTGPDPEILTPRERQIVRLVANGATSKEVATHLDLSPRTVEKQRADLMKKLGMRDVATLVRWALDRRLS